MRSEEGLLKAKEAVNEMKKDFGRNRKCLNIDEYEYRNMLTVASLIIDSALSRKESRGAHSRLDYTERSEDNIYHTNLVINKERELSYA